MWIMTPEGYISVVRKGGRGVLMVRARERTVLVHYCKIIGIPQNSIEAKKGTDYPYRVASNHDEVQAYLDWNLANLTYSNFKDEAKRIGGAKYADFLSKVWSDSWDLTPKKLKWDPFGWTKPKKATNAHWGCEVCGKMYRDCRCTNDEVNAFYDQKYGVDTPPLV